MLNYLENKCYTRTQHEISLKNFIKLKNFKITHKHTIDSLTGKGEYILYTSPSLNVSIADKIRIFVFLTRVYSAFSSKGSYLDLDFDVTHSGASQAR